MTIPVLLLLVLYVGYFFLINTYTRLWDKIPSYDRVNHTNGNIQVTVVVPARNEEQNIAACLDALLHQSYPRNLTEIIIVDDHSEDKTAEIVSAYKAAGVRLISLKDHVKEDEMIRSFKKKAIETAIARATGQLIITTDADCTAGKDWISTLVDHYLQTGNVLIVAPVEIKLRKTLLSIFQSMDFAVLQGITAVAVTGKLHNMCNGANLAYEKQVFHDVGGFNGIDHIASGDDMLLMDKIEKKYPGQTGYLFSGAAIVSTMPAESVRQFMHQRIRWASKATSYQSAGIKLALLLVLMVNISWLLLLTAGFFSALWFRIFMVTAFYKMLIEWRFVKKVLDFFSMNRLMPLFPLFQPLHVLYTVAAGFAGLFTKYEWKGRTVR